MKKPYTLIENGNKKVIRMNTARNIGLFNAICAESHAQQLLAPNNTRALPQRLARTVLPVSYVTEKGQVIDLPAGSYVAAYNTPESGRIKGLYYVAPITEQDVKKLEERAKKFNIKFGSKNRPDLFGLPTLKVSEMSFNHLLAAQRARLIYKSPSAKTPLIEMIEVLPKKDSDTISLVVEDTEGKKKPFSQRIYPGQILALARYSKDGSTRLCFVMPEDCFGLIAQNRLACRQLGVRANTMAAMHCVRRTLTRVSKAKTPAAKATRTIKAKERERN